MSNNVFIIAEAGVNHNGSFKEAKNLIDIAVNSGADAVKFQTFKAENLVTKDAGKAGYQNRNLKNNDSQFEMIKKLELTFDEFKSLANYATEKAIIFMSTAFDIESLEFLTSEVKVPYLKVPSGDLTNAPLLYEMAKKELPIILSTGMSTMDDIFNALSILAIGSFDEEKVPSEELIKAYRKPENYLPFLKDKVTILHCTTEYPTPYSDVNLQAMNYIKKETHLPVGYSDHTEGILVSLVAVSLGAKIIEKHFTSDKNLPGPDHAASLEPEELRNLIKEIRNVEEILGIEKKIITSSESENMDIARKSLHAKENISKGTCFTKNNLIAKRPNTGITPFKYWDLLNEKSTQFYSKDEAIKQ